MQARLKKQRPSHNLNPLRILSSLIVSFILLSNHPLQSQTPEKIKVIAITQIVAHRSLDEAKAGILAKLESEGFKVGKNLKIIEENAQGNIATANLIAKKFAGMKPDLIIPISTPSALAVKNAAKGSSIPIVFSSISDASSVSGISGATDAPDLLKTQALIKVLLSSHKKIRLGVLYNSGEANSVKTLEALRGNLDSALTLVERSVPNSNLAVDGFRALIGKVDAVYIPSDNTVFSALPKVIQIAKEHKVPTFTNVPDSVGDGIFACHGYSQFEVGQVAGHLAAKVLRGEREVKVLSPDKAEIVVNAKTAKLLGVASWPKTFEGSPIRAVE